MSGHLLSVPDTRPGTDYLSSCKQDLRTLEGPDGLCPHVEELGQRKRARPPQGFRASTSSAA